MAVDQIPDADGGILVCFRYAIGSAIFSASGQSLHTARGQYPKQQTLSIRLVPLPAFAPRSLYNPALAMQQHPLRGWSAGQKRPSPCSGWTSSRFGWENTLEIWRKHHLPTGAKWISYPSTVLCIRPKAMSVLQVAKPQDRMSSARTRLHNSSS